MLCGLKITGIFQSTLPARGATLFALSSTLRCDNFNPRSPHGERPSSSSQSFRIPSNFNPRSPHGERRIAWNSKTARSYFNPRSPLGERRWNCSKRRYTSHFNPRSPHGERLDPTKLERTSEKFQSTLPARGATQLCSDAGGSLCISIHAPRTGSDSAGNADDGTAAISIHAPRTGSDCGGSGFLARVELISIHAPRTGSDTACWATAPSRSNFNPRSPHGERPGESSISSQLSQFQSTLPARGATGERAHTARMLLISIHAPRTGSDDFCRTRTEK